MGALEAHARVLGQGDVNVGSVNPAEDFVWPPHKLNRGGAKVKI
jgi:hypothetical protein